MSSDKPTRRLLDIIDNAQAIARYTEGMDSGDLAQNSMASDAVERCLTRICEAVAKLGDQAAILPGQPWHKIRAFGNVLRHDYDDIIRERLCDIVQDDLPPLVAACESALEKLHKE